MSHDDNHSPAEPVVYLVLRDEILFFTSTRSSAGKFSFQEQIIKLIPQFLFGHDRTETQLLSPISSWCSALSMYEAAISTPSGVDRSSTNPAWESG